jgi:hypothetical protein
LGLAPSLTRLGSVTLETPALPEPAIDSVVAFFTERTMSSTVLFASLPSGVYVPGVYAIYSFLINIIFIYRLKLTTNIIELI